jgi:hypothetical protein
LNLFAVLFGVILFPQSDHCARQDVRENNFAVHVVRSKEAQQCRRTKTTQTTTQTKLSTAAMQQNNKISEEEESEFFARREQVASNPSGTRFPLDWGKSKRMRYKRWYDRQRRPSGRAERLRSEDPEAYDHLRRLARQAERTWKSKPKSKAIMSAYEKSEKRKAYLQSPAGRWKALKCTAKQGSHTLDLSREQAFALFSGSCEYCGRVPDAERLNGIDRIDNNGHYCVGNTASCCWSCNRMKSVDDVQVFLKSIKAIHTYQTTGTPSQDDSRRGNLDTTDEKLFETYRRAAELRGLPFCLSFDEFETLVYESCAYCGIHTARGVDRRDNSQGYHPENCASSCAKCNMTKGVYGVEFFVNHVASICRHSRNK